jgi:glutathione synthase/RimK-type ligase-like ATP-grasp enzyme
LLRILIPTYSNDVHATAVATALERKGHQPVLWHGADFPTRQCASIKVTQDAFSWQVQGVGLDEPAGPFDVVWFRRPTQSVVPQDLYPGDRQIAEKSAEAFYRALWQLVAPDAFWVNPFGTNLRSDSKPVQLIEAMKAGFKVPATLFSNEPAEIRRFLAEHQGHAIYKTIRPAQWETQRGVAYLFTTDVDLADLPDDDLLQISTGIFQRKLEKAYEIRVTCFGDRAFAAKLHSQENELAKADFRRAYKTLRLESMALPDELCQRCFALMRKLGIVFGCFDFVVTPDDEVFFLEVNPMGQFLWVEEGDPGVLLLDAFCEFLMSRGTGFSWAPSAQSIRFSDVREEAVERDMAAKKLHVARPDQAVSDRSRKPSTKKRSPGKKVLSRGRN